MRRSAVWRTTWERRLAALEEAAATDPLVVAVAVLVDGVVRDLRRARVDRRLGVVAVTRRHGRVGLAGVVAVLVVRQRGQVGAEAVAVGVDEAAAAEVVAVAVLVDAVVRGLRRARVDRRLRVVAVAPVPSTEPWLTLVQIDAPVTSPVVPDDGPVTCAPCARYMPLKMLLKGDTAFGE